MGGAKIEFSMDGLVQAYANQVLKPSDVVREVYRRISERGLDSAWIYVVPETETIAVAERLERMQRQGAALPLYGVPFAVKDNIDVAGMPTTAACPAFSYTPSESAVAVQKLIDAGAICIGKTNMDQFATGLCGVRSPYGACSSVFNEQYASGGSSSGSAVVVAAGQVAFALGTDTGGSGRIPAAFNNIVGIKPSLGLVSGTGVVPNCRSLDTVSVFALTCAEGERVLKVMQGLDLGDPFSRAAIDAGGSVDAGSFRFGILANEDREFFGDADEGNRLYEAGIERLASAGGKPTHIPFEPFREAGSLMFGGPWVAERFVALDTFMSSHGERMLPVIRAIVESSRKFSAADTFEAFYRLKALRRRVVTLWDGIDLMAVPTAPRPLLLTELAADPFRLNDTLGYYAYHVNLLDLAAVAIPNGFHACGVASGLTLIGPRGSDALLASVGEKVQRRLGIAPGVYGKASRIVAPGSMTVA